VLVFGKWRNGQIAAQSESQRFITPERAFGLSNPSEDWIVIPVAPIVDEDLRRLKKLEQNRVRLSAKQGPITCCRG